MLYQNEGIYKYHYGLNWRALATLLIVVPINLPGLIHAINSKVYIGNLAYFCVSPLILMYSIPC
jgi:NCS1 family nucleobase:cation symporter-1